MKGLATIERFIKLNPSSPALDYALYLRGVMNFSDDIGVLGSLAGQDCRSVTSARRVTPTRHSSSWSNNSPTRITPPMPGCVWTTSSELAGEIRVVCGTLLLQARCLSGGRQPRAAGGFGLRDFTDHRRGAVHHGAKLRPRWVCRSCATMPTASSRRTSRAAPEDRHRGNEKSWWHFWS